MRDPHEARHQYLLRPCSIRCSYAVFSPVSAGVLLGDDNEEACTLRHRLVIQLAESCPNVDLNLSVAQYRGICCFCELQEKMKAYDQYRALNRCAVESIHGMEGHRYCVTTRHETGVVPCSAAGAGLIHLRTVLVQHGQELSFATISNSGETPIKGRNQAQMVSQTCASECIEGPWMYP